MLDKQDLLLNNNRVGFSLYDDRLSAALRATQAYAKKEGLVVASMPEMLVLRGQASFTDPIWNRFYSCNSEENVGRTSNRNKVMIEVHGGGILTPDRIETAYGGGLTRQGAAHLTETEVRRLLEGKLADKTEIPVYSFTEFKGGIANLPRRYAVVMDYTTAKNAAFGELPVESLRENPVVIVRAGGVAEANTFVDRIAQRYVLYANWHQFNEINTDEPQGRMLSVGDTYFLGLNGKHELDSRAGFVGLAPKALIARSVDEKELSLREMVGLQSLRDLLQL